MSSNNNNVCKYTTQTFNNDIFNDTVVRNLSTDQLAQLADTLNALQEYLEPVYKYELWYKNRNGPLMKFGKHKGKPIKSLPESYVKWIIEKSDMWPDTKEFIKNAYYD